MKWLFKNLILLVPVLGFIFICMISCDKEDNKPDDKSFTDSRDGRVYKFITIGDQVWMAENLKYLPSVVGPDEEDKTTPYYYVYGYNGTGVDSAKSTENFKQYGVLYNWEAAKSACPPGWHLPTLDEWQELADYLGGGFVCGGKMKEVGTSHWISPNGDATNETGFTALPGGSFSISEFREIGARGYWWSATKNSSSSSFIKYMELYYGNGVGLITDAFPSSGMSVRCIKD